MKPLIPIIIAIGVTVAIILTMLVSIPYQEEQEQKKLAQEGLDELSKCMQIQQQLVLNPFIDQSQNQMIVKQYADCIDNVSEKYLTDEMRAEIDEMNSIQPTYEYEYEYEFNKPTVNELKERKAEFIEVCSELFYCQIEKLNRCIANADLATNP